MFPLRAPPSHAVTGPGQRERNRQHTHDALVTAAMRLCATQGFAATSVDDIAAAAGVSVRTFFRYFAAKEDVIFARSMDIGGLVAALAAQPSAVAPLEAIRLAYHAQPPPTRAEVEIHVLFHCAMSSSPALQGRYLAGVREFRSALAAALAARAGRSEATDLDVLTATIGQTVLDHALTTWMTKGARGDMGAAVDAAFAGLGAVLGEGRPGRAGAASP